MSKEGSILSTSLQNKSVVENIIDKIISAIIAGELAPGDQLPTEIELCRDLGVGRNSVREAIKKLEAYGVVYIKRAEGTFVSETCSQKMLDPMLYGLILQKKSWGDLIGLRSVIDIGTLHVVMSRELDEEDREEFHRILEEMEKSLKKESPSVDEIIDVDMRFHMAIARATKNEPVVNITEYITRITLPSRNATVRRILETPGETENFLELHRQMVEIIEKKDYSRVDEVVMDHYVYWKESK